MITWTILIGIHSGGEWADLFADQIHLKGLGTLGLGMGVGVGIRAVRVLFILLACSDPSRRSHFSPEDKAEETKESYACYSTDDASDQNTIIVVRRHIWFGGIAG